MYTVRGVQWRAEGVRMVRRPRASSLEGDPTIPFKRNGK